MFYPNIQQERERKKEAIGMVGGVMAIAGVSQVVSMINSTLGINPSLVTQILEGVAVTMGPVLFKNSIAKSLEAKALDPTLLNYVKEGASKFSNLAKGGKGLINSAKDKLPNIGNKPSTGGVPTIPENTKIDLSSAQKREQALLESRKSPLQKIKEKGIQRVTENRNIVDAIPQKENISKMDKWKNFRAQNPGKNVFKGIGNAAKGLVGKGPAGVGAVKAVGMGAGMAGKGLVTALGGPFGIAWLAVSGINWLLSNNSKQWMGKVGDLLVEKGQVAKDKKDEFVNMLMQCFDAGIQRTAEEAEEAESNQEMATVKSTASLILEQVRQKKAHLIENNILDFTFIKLQEQERDITAYINEIDKIAITVNPTGGVGGFVGSALNLLGVDAILQKVVDTIPMFKPEIAELVGRSVDEAINAKVIPPEQKQKMIDEIMSQIEKGIGVVQEQQQEEKQTGTDQKETTPVAPKEPIIDNGTGKEYKQLGNDPKKPGNLLVDGGTYDPKTGIVTPNDVGYKPTTETAQQQIEKNISQGKNESNNVVSDINGNPIVLTDNKGNAQDSAGNPGIYNAATRVFTINPIAPKSASLKINSTTFLMKRGSVGYSQIEELILKIATENDLTDVNQVDMNISPEGVTTDFNKEPSFEDHSIMLKENEELLKIIEARYQLLKLIADQTGGDPNTVTLTPDIAQVIKKRIQDALQEIRSSKLSSKEAAMYKEAGLGAAILIGIAGSMFTTFSLPILAGLALAIGFSKPVQNYSAYITYLQMSDEDKKKVDKKRSQDVYNKAPEAQKQIINIFKKEYINEGISPDKAFIEAIKSASDISNVLAEKFMKQNNELSDTIKEVKQLNTKIESLSLKIDEMKLDFENKAAKKNIAHTTALEKQKLESGTKLELEKRKNRDLNTQVKKYEKGNRIEPQKIKTEEAPIFQPPVNDEKVLNNKPNLKLVPPLKSNKEEEEDPNKQAGVKFAAWEDLAKRWEKLKKSLPEQISTAITIKKLPSKKDIEYFEILTERVYKDTPQWESTDEIRRNIRRQWAKKTTEINNRESSIREFIKKVASETDIIYKSADLILDKEKLVIKFNV